MMVSDVDRYSLKRVFSAVDADDSISDRSYQDNWLYEWAMSAPEKKWKRYYLKSKTDIKTVCIHSVLGDKYYIAVVRPRGKFPPCYSFGDCKWPSPEEAQAALDKFAEEHDLKEVEA